MKRLQLILLVLIMFLVPNVYASEFNMNNYTSATKNGTKNRYQGTEIYNTGGNFTYTFGTRYNGRLSEIETYFSYPFEKNTTYRFTYNMATNDFNNNFGSSYWWDCEHDSSATVFIPTYVSYKKVQYSITPTENTTCLRVSIRGKNLSTGNITQISNWNLSSITLYDPDYQSGSGGGQGTTPTPTSTPGASNQDIINSNEHNTQDIINSQNDNTTDIIDNNNENTDKIIDNEKDLLGNCYYNYLQPSDYIDTSGYRGFKVELEEGEIYTLLNTAQDKFGFKIGAGIYGYTDVEQWSLDSNRYTFTYHKNPSNTGNSYTFLWFAGNLSITNLNSVEFVLTKGDYHGGFIPYATEKCTSKLDETTNAINQQNEYLMDNSDPNISDNEFTTLFDSVIINNPLSSLLQLPVQFINALVNQSNSCQVVNLGTMLGVAITLPCIDIGSILGSTVWNTIDILSSIGLIVLILKQLYESITNALTLGGYMDAKKGGLGYMPPLEFLCSILTGGFGGDF